MASIRKEIAVQAPVERVWEAMRDYGAVHERVAPGFVVNTTMEGRDRVVTFFNGLVAKELLVELNDETRRLAYSAVGGTLTHHNASFQAFDDGDGGTRLVWIADLLPDELAGAIGEMMERGGAVAKATLEAGVGASV